MTTINIRRDNSDPFYRYKMPPIQSKVEGRGNGIKTAVVNCSDVARALSRPPSYIIKYFGAELGAQTSITDATDRYLVNGQHDSGKLQDLLDGFINRFVLCGSCKNPETDIINGKDDILTRDCKACGQRTPIDVRHKLYTFISKNPIKKSGGKKRGAHAAASVGNGQTISDIANNQNDDEDGSDDELTKKINAEAASLDVTQVADDDWAVDMSEKAVRERAAALEAGIANLALSPDALPINKLDEFGEWLVEFEDKDELPSDVDIYKKAYDLGIHEDPKTTQVLAQTLFDEDIVNQLTVHQGLLKKLITSPEHEKFFLGGIERFLGLEHQELIPLVPKILHSLYDSEIIEEESILKWGTKVSKKYVPKDISKKVRKAAKPFIEWLQSAESESESESE